jgi:hypothetical protein
MILNCSRSVSRVRSGAPAVFVNRQRRRAQGGVSVHAMLSLRPSPSHDAVGLWFIKPFQPALQDAVARDEA